MAPSWDSRWRSCSGAWPRSAHAGAHLYSGPAIPSIDISAATGFAFVTLTSTVAGFSLARFALGLGEAGNFPASIKAVAEWFPKKERALATGIFNSGTNVGALLAPIAVPWITLTWGWEWAFIATGALGFAWLIAWLAMYQPPQRHPRVSTAELAYIQSDPIEAVTPVAWGKLLPHRQTWAFAVGKFMTDPIWWLYLYWVPDFLHRVHHIDLKGSALPIFVIYQIATVGSIAGGWLPARLLNRGMDAERGAQDGHARARAVRAADRVRAAGVEHVARGRPDRHRGLGAPGVVGEHLHVFVRHVPEACGRSVVGIGGMAGAVGGMFISLLVGQILQRTGSYVPIFIMAGCAYLVALGCIHLLVPTIRQVTLDES